MRDHTRASTVRGALAGVALGGLLLACDDEAPARDERLPLPEVELPRLSCAALPETRGECARDADCGEDQRCALTRRLGDRDVLELACAAPVGTGDVRARCESGNDCETGLCALPGVCFDACGSDADCDTGEVCGRIEARVSDGLVSARGCTRSVAFAEDVALRRIEPRPALTAGSSTVDTPGGRGNTLLFLQAARCATGLVVDSLRSRADDALLFDLEAALTGVPARNPVSNTGPLLPVLVPNNPRVEASARGYELDVLADAAADLEVVVASREGRGSTLDLNLFYVGGGSTIVPGGLHPGAEQVARIVDELRTRYALVGIDLGEVREYDVQGGLRDDLASVEIGQTDSPQLDQLFELSAGVDDSGLDIFLVRDIRLEPEGVDVLGISSGIPGALGLHGSSLSGIALALDLTGEQRAALVLMHEMSHQMGLFHTSESDGFVLEPLSDTPTCGSDRDANGDAFVTPSECRGAGADNLMFWAGSGTSLSAQQIEILPRSLVLR